MSELATTHQHPPNAPSLASPQSPAAYLQHVNQSSQSPSYSRGDLVKWWEARRLKYNLLVGLVGVITWVLVLCVGSQAVKPGVDFEEPFMMIIGPIIYGIFANLCYSLGWVVDTTIYRGRARTVLYKAGLTFSLFLTAVPGIWAIVAWCITLYTGRSWTELRESVKPKGMCHRPHLPLEDFRPSERSWAGGS